MIKQMTLAFSTDQVNALIAGSKRADIRMLGSPPDIGCRIGVREHHYYFRDESMEHVIFASSPSAVFDHFVGVQERSFAQEAQKEALRLRTPAELPVWAMRLHLIVERVRHTKPSEITEPQARDVIGNGDVWCSDTWSHHGGGVYKTALAALEARWNWQFGADDWKRDRPVVIFGFQTLSVHGDGGQRMNGVASRRILPDTAVSAEAVEHA